MKKWFVCLFSLIPLLIATKTYAATVPVNNSFYVHTNQSGSTLLHDNSGHNYLQGDYNQDDAVIRSIDFNLDHLGSGKLYIQYPDGTKTQVTSSTFKLSPESKKVNISVENPASAEVLVYVTSYLTYDQSDGGTDVRYNYQSPSEQYGSIGSGGDTGGTGIAVDNKFYYQDYNDRYRLDYSSVPAGTDTVKLLFTTASGTQYTREWSASEVGGTMYLTCPGTYQVLFQGSGKTLGSIGSLQTNSIQTGVCSSFPEPMPTNDLNAVLSEPCTPDGTQALKWEPKSGATSYDIYKDGQKVESVTDTAYPITDPGSYSVVARGGDGAVLGQADVNTPFVTQTGGTGASDGLCKCIQDLKPSLDDIAANTKPIHDDLQQIHQDLGQVNDNLKEVLRQITPTKDYPLPSAANMPDLFKPDPVMSQPYENNQTYFKDNGDAPTPDAMPAAPEPKNWTFEGVELIQGEETKQEPVTKPDEPVKPDAVIQKQDAMQPDTPTPADPVLSAEPVLTKSPELTPQKDNSPLRWDSSQYNP